MSAVEFDIISAGAGNVQFPGGKANTTFVPSAQALGYNIIHALSIDATPLNTTSEQGQPMPIPGLSDGDFDAFGGSISAPAGNVDPTQGALLQSGDFELVATENWTVSQSDFLNLYLVGAEYFSDNTGTKFAKYTAVFTSVSLLPFPNPPRSRCLA
jgi:hypothetical protein